MKRSWGLDRILLIVWFLILAGQAVDRARHDPQDGLHGLGSGEGPGSPHHGGPHGFGRAPLVPHFSPVAGFTPLIGGLPSPVGSPGAFGQGQGAFTPPQPSSFGVIPPPTSLIPQGPLGQGPGTFAPGAPQLPVLPLAGNAPQTLSGEGIPLFVPFALGPTAILNQFVQPPLIPFGQVGVPPQAYLPGFFTGNGGTLSRSCNYYFFAGCGANGGAEADFNFSTR